MYSELQKNELRNAANESIPAGRKIAFAIIHNTTKVVNMYLSKL